MEQMFETREEWLQAAASMLREPMRDSARVSVPDVRIRTGGQTWARAASADGVNEITVRVDVHDAIEVLCILGHELIHAALDCKGAHGKAFQRAFFGMGYTGNPKSADAGEELRAKYTMLAESLGQYPSADGLAVAAQKRKQTTRMIKCACQECGFIFRTTSKWVEGRTLTCPDADCAGNVEVYTQDEED